MLHLILLFCLWFCALWFFRCTKLRSLWRLMCAVGKSCCRVTESWCFSHNFILLISCLYFVIIYFYFISYLLFPRSHKQNNKWVWPMSAIGKKIKKEKKACGLDVRKTRMHFESNIVEARIHCFLFHDLFDSTPCVSSTFSCGFTDLSSSLLYPFNYFSWFCWQWSLFLSFFSAALLSWTTSLHETAILPFLSPLTSEQYVLSKELLFTVFTFAALLILDRHAFALLSSNVLFHLRSPKSHFMRKRYAVEW